MKTLNFATCLLATLLTLNLFSQDSEDDIFSMSLEELMNIEVTSVSKKAENFTKIPSSIYVITSNDIERSSATNLMELLRESVPGYWAVSTDYKNVDAYIRTVNEGAVLILLDGTPLFDLMEATFDYKNFNIPLSAIDRIEVIKGSGGTIYGANSASGVISIFTKESLADSTAVAEIRVASPTFVQGDLLLKTKIGEKITVNGFVQGNFFKGFEQMDIVSNDSPTVNISETETGTIKNRFTEDDNITQSIATGAKLAFTPNDRVKISSDLYLNTTSYGMYESYIKPESTYLKGDNPNSPRPAGTDTALFRNINTYRFTGNITGAVSFSDNHNAFCRISTNAENSHYHVGGGFNTNNSIYDIEIQDNLTIAFNEFAIGGNYRILNYNISDLTSEESISYFDKVNTETLTGLFVQDRISVIPEKLFLIPGVKAENFSLIDDKYYLSPMAKAVYSPNSKISLWASFTKAHTTPGYNQTNIELSMFRATSPDVFYDFTKPFVEYGVYAETMALLQSEAGGGLDQQTADAATKDFMASAEGQYLIDSLIKQNIVNETAQFPGHYNVTAINGKNTTPTSISTYELGFRIIPSEKIYIESNFYFMQLKDGITSAPASMAPTESLTKEGEFMVPYYYGNYMKGNNIGIETIIKVTPIDNIMVELSHSYFSSNLEYQENEDFDISELSESAIDLSDNEFPTIPQHIIRAKLWLDLPKSTRLNVSTLYASKFFNRFGTIVPFYQPQNQRYEPLFGDNQYRELFGEQENRLVLNCRIDKFFVDDKLNLFVFGNDILSSPFVESSNQIATTYPRQVGGMYGIGINYKF